MTRISVLIPTRNRNGLANIAVRTALEALGADDQVIVGDNSDLPFVYSNLDPRLRISRPSQTLSMPENWRSVVSMATGEWLVVISDKCRIVPGAFDRLLNMVGNHDAITYVRTTFVQDLSEEQWHVDERLMHASGSLSHPRNPNQSAVRDSGLGLKRWFDAMGYEAYLPMIYNSLVHRRVADALAKEARTWFPGFSPDIDSSLQILSATKSYVQTTLPATVIQFPSPNKAVFSVGHSSTSMGELTQKFFDEFQQRGDTPRRPLLLSEGIVDTLRKCVTADPGHLSDARINWEMFAWHAASEIEHRPASDREKASLHAHVFGSLVRERAPRRAYMRQIREIVANRLPWTVGLRSRLGLGPTQETSISSFDGPAPQDYLDFETTQVTSLDHALQLLRPVESSRD